MNKNTVIGFLLIGAILIGFSWYNSKNYKEQARAQFVADSLAQVEALKNAPKVTPIAEAERENSENYTPIYKDSLLEEASRLEEEFYTLENNKIKVNFTTKGAQAYQVLVKNYYTYDSLDLFLMREKSSNFSIDFYTDQQLSTSDFVYERVSQTDSSIVMRLNFDQNSYIDHIYTLPQDSYLMSFDLRLVGMNKYISKNQSLLGLNWEMQMSRLEKGFENEVKYSTIDYKYPNESSVDDLGTNKEEASEAIKTKLEWFAFKQQYFSAILVANDYFTSGNLVYSLDNENNPDNNLMKCGANMQLEYNGTNEMSIPFKFYYGPNLYKELKSYDYGFERIVQLGSWIIGWINRLFIINFFDILSKYIVNFGIIILLMTFVIKLILFPLTYKSYISSAKMRVLKPEVDKIGEKYPKQEDAMKKQQEVMALYKKTGVNMFGGCLPALLQMPILFAMFMFFPTSFELRQQGFLWISDLSSYDSLIKLPFALPVLGDHIGLFPLLMSVSMYFLARMSVDQMSAPGPQAGMMKNMQLYFMPIVFFFVVNNFSSGLSYYYLVSNLITISQTWIIRKYFVDEEKIYAQLQAKAATAKPKKKSKFQMRLEEMQKQQQAIIEERKRQQGKR